MQERQTKTDTGDKIRLANQYWIFRFILISAYFYLFVFGGLKVV
jgi:hypothetical protein